MTEDGDGLRPHGADAPNPLAPRPPSAQPGHAGGAPTPLRAALLLVGVFAIVFGLFIVIRRPAPVPAVTYDDQTRTLFLGSCAIDGSASTRSVCECAYAAIVATVPYDRFRALDADALARRTTVSTTSPATVAGPGTTARVPPTTASPLPEDVRSIFSTCVSKQIIATPNATAPPTTTGPSTTGPSTTGPSTTTSAPPAPSLTVS